MESATYRADVPQVPQKGNSLRQSDVLVREVENVAMKGGALGRVRAHEAGPG